MTPEEPHAQTPGSTGSMNSDLALELAEPDNDGIVLVSIGGLPIGEILKGTPNTSNIAENRAETITFYEAVDTDGEFLDPLFTTAQAAAIALANHAGIRAGEHRQ